MRPAEYRRAVRRPSSPGSTTSALPRSTAYSGTAPTRVVTGGQPQAIDSRGGSANPS
jgi:hypothetical protein